MSIDMFPDGAVNYLIQRHSTLRFINRLSASLWPESDDFGAPRFQVNSMKMVLTDGGGQNVIATLRLVPGVGGLQVEWADGETEIWPRMPKV